MNEKMKTHKLSQGLLAATFLSFGSVHAATQVASERALREREFFFETT